MQNLFDRITESDFFDFQLPLIDDREHWLFDDLPDFTFREQNTYLVLPDEDRKLAPLCGTESTSVSGAKSEEPQKKSKIDSSEVSSVLSMDLETLNKNLPYIKSSNVNSSNTGPTTYDQVLLEMVDEESLSFLLKKDVQIDEQLREFISCMLEVMTKSSFKAYPEISNQEWVEKANRHIKMASQKRKDQKLRMIFNKIVKMLVNRCSSKDNGRDSKASRLSTFANRYGGSEQEAFQALIRDCKFPSKKKLKNIFIKFPAFKIELREIIATKTFENEYMLKRTKKALRLVNTYVQSQQVSGASREKTVTVLRDCIKSFPWSTEDLTTSCDLLLSTIDC